MSQQGISGVAAAQLVSETADASEMDGKYLSFWTDNQLFGVPIADVVQIVGVQTVTELPETPAYMKGVINLRGSIIPIIDVRLRLGKPEKEYDERTCIIVTNIAEVLVGFVVDAVDEVANIDSSQISPPPQINNDYEATYVTGIAKRENDVVLLVNTRRLVGEDQLQSIYEAVGEGAVS